MASSHLSGFTGYPLAKEQAGLADDGLGQEREDKRDHEQLVVLNEESGRGEKER